jgi:hypothetical protein
MEGSKQRLAIKFSYDAFQRKETSMAILPTGVEPHRRIPIDPEDVKIVAKETGLMVEDYFSSAFIPGRWRTGWACFFFLSRRG